MQMRQHSSVKETKVFKMPEGEKSFINTKKKNSGPIYSNLGRYTHLISKDIKDVYYVE